ncbi:PIN-like domain-containing protein [Streptomyces anulatus]|uniref:PIN-like domain-containing protein n=1 Tax=Streptomyces anulatus TaxID=1892 RepID=UPI00386D7694|nr:PIN-like domain-containing protein [Streptomyces anulatus]
MTTAQGMFDGFEAYRTPADHDYQRVLQQGLVVLDTNVLLDLYRMNARVRQDMLTVLKTISERLWVPHQVLVEFWRNRQSEELITYHDKKAATAAEILKNCINRSRSALDEWARNVHIGDNFDIASPMYEKLDSADQLYQDVVETLERQASKDTVPGIRNTHTDPVIKVLEQLLDQRVGAPYSPEQHAQEVQRAKERADQQVPPGYKDFESGKKEDVEAAGDYLVWRQLMDAVRIRETDVLFVTRDLKEDWWRKGSAKAMRLPRIELVNEMRDLTGLQLFMVEPSTLMQQVSTVFHLEKQVDQNSVDALRHLETIESDAEKSRHSASRSRYRLAQVPGGRSNDYVETLWLMAQLVEENPQLKTCLAKFMEFFKSVTLEPEARRRLMNLVSLGLAFVQNEQILLTAHGRNFVENRDAQLLRQLFMERILGAQEARQMLAEGASVAEVKQLLDEQPDLELSATQSELLLRWMGKLELLTT